MIPRSLSGHSSQEESGSASITLRRGIALTLVPMNVLKALAIGGT